MMIKRRLRSLTDQISALALLAASIRIPSVSAWGSGNSDFDSSIYGMSKQRDWMSDSTSISLKFEGCVWGYVNDRENMGCMDDESGDGTTYWYMMANCRRAQAAYSMYASSSGSTSCNKKDFKESFVTKDGVSEFVYNIGTYGYSPPVTSDDVDSLPICEYDGSQYYYGTGCSASGQFTIDLFSDAYCTQFYQTADYLSNFNSAMKSLNKCYNTYSSKTDEDPSYSLASILVSESGHCSQAESSLCKSNNFVQNSGSYSSSSGQRASARFTSGSGSFTNNLKYGLGFAMMLGTLVMFVGILFTNRKKRRAMMHRKFRQSGGGGESTTGRSKSRSKSKSKSSRKLKKKRDASRGQSSPREGSGGGIFA